VSHQFHPYELSGADGGELTSAQLGEAVASARLLQGVLVVGDIHPSIDFADRVMSAVAEVPRPQPAIAAGLALRQGRPGALLAAFADAWRVAFSGGRPLAVRAQAAALVLLAILLAGSLGGLATVGAVRFLVPAEAPSGPTAPSQIVAPAATQAPGPTGMEPTGMPASTNTPAPTNNDEPSATDEPGATPEAPNTPRPGKTAQPTETPEPNETEEPGETDDPGETEEPGETDDHGGSSGSGGSGGGGGGEDPDGG
jgi:uncharacterized membrane protein YgcG